MSRLSFGEFELDPTSGELWKGEACVHMQEQSLKLLLCLMEKPGQVVGREELKKKVWDGDIHVEFEDCLNAAAWRLRQALGDSAERPQFIETIPRKGYRFLGKVTPLLGHPAPATGAFPLPVHRPDSGALRPLPTGSGWLRGRRLRLCVGIAAPSLLGASVIWGVLGSSPATLMVEQLQNLTEDPAVDFFAATLTRQVGEDLAATRRLRILPPSGPPGSGATKSSAKEVDMTMHWTLARDAKAYRIAVHMHGRGGATLGNQILLASPEDLHGVHGKISAIVATWAAQEASRERRSR